jgi:kumamolisin
LAFSYLSGGARAHSGRWLIRARTDLTPEAAMTVNDRTRVEGSERAPLPGAHRTADVDPQQQISVTVLVRRPDGAGQAGPDGGNAGPASGDGAPVNTEGGTALGQSTPGTAGGSDPVEARRARRRAFAAANGAARADLDQVTAFAAAHGLTVQAVEPARRTVRLAGTAQAMARAFAVDLAHYQVGTGETGFGYRGRTGYVQLPSELSGVVEAVLGLDDRPQARFDLRRGADLQPGAVPDPGAAPAANTPFWATQVASLYAFPSQSGGAGETIGLIELGGGYTQADLTNYFGQLKLSPPTVVAVGVDGGTNSPGQAADGEVELDIQVAGAVAPKATVIVYFAPNTDAGFLDAITTAVHDQQHAPSVISISWGGPESSWTSQAMTAMDQAFADAAAVGVTVLCAAGDHGAGDAAGDTRAHADFPASSPHNVACGGTTLQAGAGAISTEVAWNDHDGWATGGGVSDVFAVPTWQASANVPPSVNSGGRRGRGLPDVAGNADSATGYIVVVDGSTTVVGGTSAVAPLYAGLVALLNSALGHPVGELSVSLYSAATASGGSPFRDVTSGNNGVPASSFGAAVTGYPASAGWDACTGWGSINGTALLTALRAGVAPAAQPQQVSAG